MAFTAADVKKLREMTSVGMMDCKKALTEADATSTRLSSCSVRRAWLRLLRRQTASLLRVWSRLPYVMSAA